MVSDTICLVKRNQAIQAVKPFIEKAIAAPNHATKSIYSKRTNACFAPTAKNRKLSSEKSRA